MGFIPLGAKWYVAKLVVAISVGHRKKVTVHINTVLVRADSPSEAYDKALALGRQERLAYRNTAGEKVRIRFLGLRDLSVIHDELTHGCELVFSERLGKTISQAKALVSRKRELGVFAPIVPTRAPNYMSADIVRELKEALKMKSRVIKQSRQRRSSR